MKSILLLERVSKVCLYALILLIPLWFLPITQNVLDFQKQALFLPLVFLGLIAWLGYSISQGEIRMRFSPLHIPVALFVGMVALSSVFSVWRYGSFWGWPQNITDTAVGMLGFGLLYLLISQIAEGSKTLFRLALLLLISGTLAGVFALVQMYGVFLLPIEAIKTTAFNTIGSPSMVALFSAILLPLALVLAFSSKLLLRAFLWVLVFLLLGIVTILNSQIAWMVLSAELLVLLVFGMVNLKKRMDFGWISFPMAFLVIAMFFGMFQVSVPGAPEVPIEVSLSRQAEWSIAKEVLGDRPLFGSGPGTFQIAYAEHHSPAVNETIFWNTRFNAGVSELLDWILMTGILGSLLLFGAIGTGLFLGVRRLFSQDEDHVAWMMGLGALSSFVGIVLAFILSSVPFVLWFVFWVLLAMLAVTGTGRLKTVSIAPPSVLAVGASFSFLLVLIFGLGLLFVGGQKYAAEVQYLKGARASLEGNIEESLERVTSAAQLNPSADLYWRELSQLYLVQLSRVSQRQDLTEEQRQQQMQLAASNAVAAARQAVTVADQNVANWIVQGFIYRNLIGAEGADAFAIASYERAAELEPASPFSWTEIGRVRILQAQQATDKDTFFEMALEDLQKALELKQDYAPAHYLVAAVREQQGQVEEAIVKLEDAKRAAPRDIGLAFQLGSMYRTQKNLTAAAQEFRRALQIDPEYANARYMLGLVYDEQGEKDLAIAEFERVAAANPDNGDLPRILQNLRQGLPALEGLNTEPPLQEAPPEINE
ncbi:MAG: tetratricopeptide repeat protein [Candidatus Yanofskybacteria bacterium]|nr:tetratricopeptide repeat protein [Candidatus Yanofskybacteria bacterium]